MVELSQTDIEFIGDHPLNGCLDSIRTPLEKALAIAGTPTDDGDFKNPGRTHQLVRAIDQLLFALRNHDAADGIKSSGSLDLRGELLKIMDANQRNFVEENFSALISLVLDEGSDLDIWTAVLNLIPSRTPPSSIQPCNDATPVVRSSSSYHGSEQTKRHLEAALQYELMDRTYRDVGGFFDKFFPSSQRLEKICNDICTRGKDFPDPPDEKEVWKWLSGLQNQFFPKSPGVYHTTDKTSELAGGEAARQLDILMKPRTSATEKHLWEDIALVGELKQSYHGTKEMLLQLMRYVRDIFTAQPTRRFVHGFFLHGTTMELWVFDRSGPYSSGEFDIREDHKKFIRALVGYAFMNEEELGLDTFITKRRTKRTIAVDKAGETRRIQIQPKPFVIQRAVVCRGTTCFRTEDGKGVVKFSWTSDKRQPESELLERARQRNVQGVARLVGYRKITSISELRSGLTFGEPHKFQGSLFPTSTHSSFSGLLAKSHISHKRKAQDESTRSSKRSRPSSTSSLYQSRTGFDNRIFGALAIEPCGRSLEEFTTIPELLTGLRDAIRAHRSLLLDGEILHRDISVNNIILTDCDFRGMLIDVELGKVTGSSQSGARHQTGTVQFMAIGVLRGEAHTFRHDIESFFYVLLWICGRLSWEKGILCDRKTPKAMLQDVVFTKWYRNTFEEIAYAKLGDMIGHGFKRVLSQFPAAYNDLKPLCQRLRALLFPFKDGELDLGTPPDVGRFYKQVLDEFDAALGMLESGTCVDRAVRA